MTDYKNTLNLPQTDFPMKANLAEREPQIYAEWKKIDLYNLLRKNLKNNPKFILHDGPPYANASIHMGTALNKILKDIVTKSKTLSGFDSPYVPGWDCHGLPIELNVEKKFGKVGDKLNATEFRKACRDYATSQVAIQKADFERLGVLGDWQNPYLTMQPSYEANVVRALADIIKNNHLLRGQKPVHWCTACGSALAEAEVEYRDKTSPSIDVLFEAFDLNKLETQFNLSLVNQKIYAIIWTTTPWTLPANEAISVNPELAYVLVKASIAEKNIYLILAESLLDNAMKKYGAEKFEILGKTKGINLENILFNHPFLNKKVPIILGDHVTTEAGTGLVHTAPAHGQDDYVVGAKYNLPMNNPVDSRSCFKENTPFVAGLHVFKANEPIIELLKDNQKLLHLENLNHSYPHCWRHKTPLIFRATPQWFVSMSQNNLRSTTLELIKKLKWIPAWGENRISKMIEARPDWCISRQRAWGIPITLFVHNKTDELHPDTINIMEKAAQLIEKDGIDAWHDCDPKDLIGDDAENYTKITDVLDVWFESGVSHACVLAVRPELKVPADLYLEGSDQHRGWFQSSLLTGVAMRNQSPFKAVLTHGYVVDGSGYKMSKSVGNTISPADIIKKSGADILRLWAASTDHTNDLNFSDEIVTRISDAYRRIRNTMRFLLSNVSDFNPDEHCIEPKKLLDLDAWIIVKTKCLQEKIIAAYDAYQFQSIYQMLHNFCTIELGSFYLDIIKDRLYTCAAQGLPRRSAQTALFYILEAMTRWLAPILSFTADEIWKYIPGKRNESVFLNPWFAEFPEVNNIDEAFWDWLIQVRNDVNKLLEANRAEGKMGSALEAKVILYADDLIYEKLIRLNQELRFILITSEASVKKSVEKTHSALPCSIDGLWIGIAVTDAKKCVRCWQRREDVGADKTHEELCVRCVDNVFGDGETRCFA